MAQDFVSFRVCLQLHAFRNIDTNFAKSWSSGFWFITALYFYH